MFGDLLVLEHNRICLRTCLLPVTATRPRRGLRRRQALWWRGVGHPAVWHPVPTDGLGSGARCAMRRRR